MSKITVYEGTRRRGSTSNAFNDIVTEELMREYTLSFSVLNTDSIVSVISETCILERGGQKFDITGIDQSQINGNITQVSAEHISYRLGNYSLAAGYAFVGTLREIAEDILSLGENIESGKKASSEFSIGNCPESETHSFRLKNTSDATVRDALITLQTLGVEIVFDNFTVNIVPRRGADRGLVIKYSTNLNEIHRTWQRGNGWTYEVRAVLLDAQAQLGDDITIINPLNGEKTQTRIIAVTECADDPQQNSIVTGVFKLDSATQAAETAQVANEAKAKADSSLQESEKYSNVYINHTDGVVAENRNGTLRVVMNGDDCFAVQVKQSDGTWETVASTEKWGVLTPRLTTPESKNLCYATIGHSTFGGGQFDGIKIIGINYDGSEKEIMSIGDMLYVDSSGGFKRPVIKADALRIMLGAGTVNQEPLDICDESGNGLYFSGMIALDDSVTGERHFLHFRSGLLWYVEDDQHS